MVIQAKIFKQVFFGNIMLLFETLLKVLSNKETYT